jgi:hypothetical protein
MSTPNIILASVGIFLILLGTVLLIKRFGSSDSNADKPSIQGPANIAVTGPVGLMIIVIGVACLVTPEVFGASQAKSAIGGGPTVRASFSPSISTTPTPTLTPIPTAVIRVKCSISQQLRPGITVQLTYDIESSHGLTVGLGAGLYDNVGTDHSTGYGDLDSVPLAIGKNTETRPVLIPGSLPPGRYELDAEIWPQNKVGTNGANTLAEATCAYFDVP